MTDEPLVPPATTALVEQITRFSKGLHRVKMALTKDVPDRAAYGLLFPLIESDKRAADLADIVHSDPSTVSRHISHLVSNELVRRVPDQQDGRAALLSLTDKGRGLCEDLRIHRANVLANTLRDWPEEKTHQLTTLLGELNDDMEANHDTVVDGFRNAFDAAAAATSTHPQDIEESS